MQNKFPIAAAKLDLSQHVIIMTTSGGHECRYFFIKNSDFNNNLSLMENLKKSGTTGQDFITEKFYASGRYLYTVDLCVMNVLGQKHGPCEVYFARHDRPGAKLFQTTNYRAGHQHGALTIYAPDGITTEHKSFYIDGKEIPNIKTIKQWRAAELKWLHARNLLNAAFGAAQEHPSAYVR